MRRLCAKNVILYPYNYILVASESKESFLPNMVKEVAVFGCILSVKQRARYILHRALVGIQLRIPMVRQMAALTLWTS